MPAYYIYALFCDKTDDIVYVGLTEDPYSRELAHTSSCKKSKLPVHKHFRKNKSKPRLELLERINAPYRTDYVNDCERRWMDMLSDCGFNIKNVVGMEATVMADKKILNKVRRHVKKSKQSIGGFYDLAVQEKLEREKQQELLTPTLAPKF